MRRDSACSVAGCQRALSSGGFCVVHLADPSAAVNRSCRNCGGAIGHSRGGGYSCSSACTKQLDQARRAEVGCAIDECDKPLSQKGYCKMHQRRFERWGDPLQTGPICTCVVCGARFTGIQQANRYCSRECKTEWRRRDKVERKDFFDQAHRSWASANRDKIRENTRRRRSRRRAGEVLLVTDRDIQRQRYRQRNECFYCGERLPDGRDQHVDHVIPQLAGGRHSVGNLVIACEPCNVSKNDWLLSEWRLIQKTGRIPSAARNARREAARRLLPAS